MPIRIPGQHGSFTNPYTGEPTSPDQFANFLGDPQGDFSFQDELNWARNYAPTHPEFRGNGAGTITVDPNGNVRDTRGFLDKHTGLLIALGMAGTGGWFAWLGAAHRPPPAGSQPLRPRRPG